ncbi:hypothetical protein [Laspinema olomoucense]|nr:MULTISPECIES: hypothetical protein [unclassified Laspinema]
MTEHPIGLNEEIPVTNSLEHSYAVRHFGLNKGIPDLAVVSLA